jgi:hypothetical protein
MANQFKILESRQKTCNGCNRSDVKHYARGLCKPCYTAWNRQRNWIKAELKGEARHRVLVRPFCFFCGTRQSEVFPDNGIPTCDIHKQEAIEYKKKY